MSERTAHVITTTDATSNCDVRGIYFDDDEAMAAFDVLAKEMAERLGDENYVDVIHVGKSEESWSYMPDDTEEYENESVLLKFDVPVFGSA